MSEIIVSENVDSYPSLDQIEKEVFDLPLDDNVKIQALLLRTITRPQDDNLPIKYNINLTLELVNSTDNIQLHWAVYTKKNASVWLHPSEKFYPKNTVDADKNSVDTSFEKNKIIFEYEIKSNDDDIFQGINFVLKNLSNGKWYNNNGQNYRIELIKREKTKYNEEDEKS